MAYPNPPEQFRAFQKDFPELASAWEAVQAAGSVGPLDERTQRLVKFAVAVGSGREGAISSAVRKALACGVSLEMLDQTLRLSAGTIGFPATVAAYGVVRREAAKLAATEASTTQT